MTIQETSKRRNAKKSKCRNVEMRQNEQRIPNDGFMVKSRVIQVVVNPISGRAGRRSALAGFCRRATDEGWHVRVHETQGPGEVAAVAGRSCRESLRALVVAGGMGR